jgi:hypothetical protein
MWWLLPVLLSHADPDPAATHRSYAERIPIAMRERMVGVTWREGCPLKLDELSLLHVPHHDMDGNVQEGLLIVASEHATAVLQVFSALYEVGFPIRRMRPAHEFEGSDDASMAADNTSAFNCRPITGGSGFSQHSYGHAIDINTIENPYVRGSRVLPPAGTAYTDRADVRPGMITADGPVVEAFSAIGWSWGGSWRSLKDYQHFSANGR